MDAGIRDSLRRKKLFLLDMDGTLYLGNRLFPQTLPFLQAIRQAGADYLFLTNNSSRGTKDYVNKLTGLGIPCAPEDFFTSTHAALVYLKLHHPGELVYALGTASFREQLAEAGIRVTDRIAPAIGVLLMGYDTELNYQKLVDACALINEGLPYLATNPDWVCPTATGYLPDCGSMAQMLEHATGRLPHVLGKPRPDIALTAMAQKNCAPKDCVLVGDRLYTDIACANNAGAAGILVLSGETKADALKESDIQPYAVVQNVGELTGILTG
ncbi:MAG: HAD-IIA family hydrolase [Eubacteriales bacterium]|nr:HAD-IIA family hydrolase [Eubacteriales bacterium]